MKERRTVDVGLALAVGGLLAATFVGCGGSVQSTESETATPIASATKSREPSDGREQVAGTGKGMAAMRQAAGAGKYLLLFFSKTQDEQTTAMRKIFDAVVEKEANRADGIVVDITDPAEQSIVEKFDLKRAPMPLVLAMAPNGAVTAGLPTKFDEQQLLGAFVSRATANCMKALQDGKLVLLCIQNAQTKANDDAMKGVKQFKADEPFGEATTVVSLDPTDKEEAAFLADLQVAPETTQATTVFIVPPGRPIAKYEGATDKDALVDAVTKANVGCGPGGCGPGGCCPAK